MPSSPVRVLLVDDSPLALTILSRMLSTCPDIQVVGMAHSGREALETIPRLQPAVICTDLHMPDMDGLELTQAVMRHFPRPILVVSVAVHEEDRLNVFRLLDAGAIDVLPKPRGGLEADDHRVAQELISKIKILSGVVPLTRSKKILPTKLGFQTKVQPAPKLPHPRIVAIGASTGGPQALRTILAPCRADFPIPILCVQHISDGFLPGLVAWLASHCAMVVKIAPTGERPLPGTIYFPPEGTHLEIDQQGRFVSSYKPPVDGHRPSVTVTFKSVAEYWGSAAIGILLTGMGSDGAMGMQAVFQAGGITIAQDEKTSVVFGMPKQAIVLEAVQYILPLSKISPRLLELIIGE